MKKNKLVKRWWALIIAILLTLVNLRLILIALFTFNYSPAEKIGELIAYLVTFALFYFIAFFPKKIKKNS